MCRSWPSKTARLCDVLTKTSIENPLGLRRLKAIQSSRRVNHCFSLFVLVPGGGVEPPRPEGRRILSPLRLPVPPSRLYLQVLDFKV